MLDDVPASAIIGMSLFVFCCLAPFRLWGWLVQQVDRVRWMMSLLPRTRR